MTKGAAVATAAPFAFVAPAWAEVCDKMGPGTFDPPSVPIFALLFLVWLVGLGERWPLVALPPALLFMLTGWFHLADRLALARGDGDPSLCILESAIREGCRATSHGPGWVMLGVGAAMALTVIVDRLRRGRARRM